jgi:uncharacterized protein YcnI
VERNVGRRRVRFVVVAAAMGMAGWPAAASAHATFVGSASVPANSDQTLTINAEEERGPEVHNSKVIVEIAPDFTAVSCKAKAGWTCSKSSASRGRTLLTWVRESGTDPDGKLTFSVRTPGRPGDFPFEVNQFYSDGKASRWDGPPESESPAPVLTVT